MKKFGLILLVAAVVVACGNKTKDDEQARLDSIAQAEREAFIADSIAKAEAQAQQLIADSIAKADSIAAAEAAAKGKKVAPKQVTKQAPKQEAKIADSKMPREATQQSVTDINNSIKMQQPEKTLDQIKKEAKEKAAKDKFKKLSGDQGN